jgi:hypothetical protein
LVIEHEGADQAAVKAAEPARDRQVPPQLSDQVSEHQDAERRGGAKARKHAPTTARSNPVPRRPTRSGRQGDRLRSSRTPSRIPRPQRVAGRSGRRRSAFPAANRPRLEVRQLSAAVGEHTCGSDHGPGSKPVGERRIAVLAEEAVAYRAANTMTPPTFTMLVRTKKPTVWRPICSVLIHPRRSAQAPSASPRRRSPRARSWPPV